MEELKGVVSDIVFRNDENGWTVLELTPSAGSQLTFTALAAQGDGVVTAVGSLPAVAPGQTVELTGQWVSHREYGTQFKFSAGFALPPDGSEAIERYLASGLIKGVGAATARNIVNRFGDEALDILENHPERLAEIRGISLKKAGEISASYLEQHGMRAIVMGLQSYGISSAQAVKLYKLYGQDTLARVRQNPYQLIDDVEGIGFRTADQIAQNVGFGADSPFRVSAGLKYTLNWARTDGGHTCLPMERLTAIAAESLRCDEELCREQLEELILSGQLLARQIDGVDCVFLPFLYQWESECARMLLQLRSHPVEASGIDCEMELSALERTSDTVLDALQKQAVLTAARQGVLVITGGPGTGKTTIVDFILALMEKLGLSIELCAPTGRAAKRLSEATGMEARTIHRLLEYNGDSFGRNADSPLEADVYIADEASMIDVQLMYHLLCALPQGARLILVGDVDQLPSVGAGNVLGDAIASGTLPVVRLTEIFRQSSRSRIVVNAHRINCGEVPLLDYTGDFAFEERSAPEMILSRIVGICQNGKLGDPWSEVQVLSPTKKGMLGVRNLNLQLQAALNPPSRGKAERAFGELTFRVGDKVMQIKNDYQMEWTKPGLRGTLEGAGVFNGDIGTIMAVHEKEKVVEILFDDERTCFYEYPQLEELDLAYCISIHKSQGSEFPTVLLPLCGGPPMLMTRNLLYTAVTRARSRVVIIGRQATVEAMVANNHERKRYSALGACLRELEALYG